MELIYKNKKSLSKLEEIITQAKQNINNISKNNEKGIFIKNDNFLGMISLLKNFENKIDLVYIDPPFNTNSTFFYDEENVSTISSKKDVMVAYNDSMIFEEYLEFIRERIYLIWKLLSDNGTLYFHIDLKVGHYIKIILDEIFGKDNFLNDISRIKSNPKNFNRKAFGNQKDVIFIYSKKVKKNIFNNIKISLSQEEISKAFKKCDENGFYTTIPCHAPGETKNGDTGGLWKGIYPPKGRHWRTSPKELDAKGLIEWSKTGNPRIKKYADEHQGKKIQDIWLDYKDPQKPIYPTEKNNNMLKMIIEQSSNENSIIMDCFCGSSSFLKEGIKLNRYVIGIDKSDIALNIILNKREELKELKIITDIL